MRKCHFLKLIVWLQRFYLWCSIAFCRKINCSPFLLNKPLVNITEMAGECFLQILLNRLLGGFWWVQISEGAEAPAQLQPALCCERQRYLLTTFKRSMQIRAGRSLRPGLQVQHVGGCLQQPRPVSTFWKTDLQKSGWGCGAVAMAAGSRSSQPLWMIFHPSLWLMQSVISPWWSEPFKFHSCRYFTLRIAYIQDRSKHRKGIIKTESFQLFILCVLMLDDMVNECKVVWNTKAGDPGPFWKEQSFPIDLPALRIQCIWGHRSWPEPWNEISPPLFHSSS